MDSASLEVGGSEIESEAGEVGVEGPSHLEVAAGCLAVVFDERDAAEGVVDVRVVGLLLKALLSAELEAGEADWSRVVVVEPRVGEASGPGSVPGRRSCEGRCWFQASARSVASEGWRKRRNAAMARTQAAAVPQPKMGSKRFQERGVG